MRFTLAVPILASGVLAFLKTDDGASAIESELEQSDFGVSGGVYGKKPLPPLRKPSSPRGRAGHILSRNGNAEMEQLTKRMVTPQQKTANVLVQGKKKSLASSPSPVAKKGAKASSGKNNTHVPALPKKLAQKSLIYELDDSLLGTNSGYNEESAQMLDFSGDSLDIAKSAPKKAALTPLKKKTAAKEENPLSPAGKRKGKGDKKAPRPIITTSTYDPMIAGSPVFAIGKKEDISPKDARSNVLDAEAAELLESFHNELKNLVKKSEVLEKKLSDLLHPKSFQKAESPGDLLSFDLFHLDSLKKKDAKQAMAPKSKAKAAKAADKLEDSSQLPQSSLLF